VRAAYRVGIDHRAGVAKCDVLVAGRCLNGLIVDASIGHHDAQFYQGGNGALFQIEHRRGLTQKRGLGKISAPWISDGGNAHTPLPLGRRGESLQPAHARFAEAFRVGHDVCLRHRNEILGAEEIADLYLVLQRLLRNRAEIAGQDMLLFVVQLHRCQSIVVPESRAALPHLTGSPYRLPDCMSSERGPRV
jgi:hypothetical protein